MSHRSLVSVWLHFSRSGEGARGRFCGECKLRQNTAFRLDARASRGFSRARAFSAKAGNGAPWKWGFDGWRRVLVGEVLDCIRLVPQSLYAP